MSAGGFVKTGGTVSSNGMGKASKSQHSTVQSILETLSPTDGINEAPGI